MTRDSVSSPSSRKGRRRCFVARQSPPAPGCGSATPVTSQPLPADAQRRHACGRPSASTVGSPAQQRPRSSPNHQAVYDSPRTWRFICSAHPRAARRLASDVLARPSAASSTPRRNAILDA
ncbi:hypothetical protein D1007_26895 [Hordeum vulgare]|nr:hypothetical protein D1007_26895 [Hordeum vulgare]